MLTTICARRHPLSLSLLAVPTALLIAACGSTSTTTGGGSTSAGSSPSAAADNGTGEQAGVPYTNAQFHYKVDAPGQVAAAADGSISAQRGVEGLRVSVVTGAAVADPQRYAQTDMAIVQPGITQFRVINALAPATIGGRTVAKIVYSSSHTNAVTGRTEELTSARYYIPRDSSTLAVLTYFIVSTQYDPQGADDVATTFVWQ